MLNLSLVNNKMGSFPENNNVQYMRAPTLHTETCPCVRRKKENTSAEAGRELTSEDYGGYST